MSSNNNSFDVIIVGLGPVGTVLANLLGNYDLSILVLEKSQEIHPAPRAIHFDGEVMRVFQNAGLASKIRSIARSTHKGMHFVGKNNETLLVRKGLEGVGDQGWENNWYFFQPDLEKTLRAGLRRFSNITVRLGENVTHIKDSDSKISVSTQVDLSEEEFCYEGTWMIGCDGARSIVSKKIPSGHDNLGLDEKWLVVDLKIRDGSIRAAKLPDYTIQHCDPERPMTRCYISSLRRRWEIMILPGDNIESMGQTKFIWSLLEPWLSPEDADIERAQIYTFHSLIRKEWKNDHIVLAGDSAHQSPPFLGQGLCAGIRDASALAWRLGLILEKKASEKTINSYVEERKSHVREFIDLAVKCGKTIKSGDPKLISKYFQQGTGTQTNVFDFPKPQLGLGDWVKGVSPLGQISPQFLSKDGFLSDNYALYKFIMFQRHDLKRLFSRRHQKIIQNWGICIVEATMDMEKWLDLLGATAALIRPDRYLYGIASDFEEEGILLEHFECTMLEGEKNRRLH